MQDGEGYGGHGGWRTDLWPRVGGIHKHRFGCRSFMIESSGEVAEWLMAPVLKTGIPERVSGVRIPPSPPCMLRLRFASGVRIPPSPPECFGCASRRGFESLPLRQNALVVGPLTDFRAAGESGRVLRPR